MNRRGLLVLLALLAVAPVCAGQPAAPPKPAEVAAPKEVVVLDAGSFWRTYFWLRPAVVRRGDKVETVDMGAAWLNRDTEPPPLSWWASDFDDSSWARTPAGFVNCAWRGMSPLSPEVAVECRRGKFEVTDPAAAGELTLALSYAGGAVVYLNGKEIARGHLRNDPAAAPLEALADDYPSEATDKPEMRTRELAGVTLPKGLLRRGTNVLAIELHRAACGERDVSKDARGHLTIIRAGTCGLVGVKLSAPGADGLVPNVTRPKGFHVWNSDVTAADFDLDYGDSNEPLRPVTLAAARSGACSGKVVVGSDEPIKGLKAEPGALRQKPGAGVIGASAVQVRYALPWGSERGTAARLARAAEAAPKKDEPMSRRVREQIDAALGEGARYPVQPDRFDALAETAPAEVPVRVKDAPRGLPAGMEVRAGAVVPVWVTVSVPADAPPGDYEGTLTIRADGQKPVAVPLKLTVSAWKLPPPRDWRAIVEFIQSPDTLAIEYDVPLWSDRHFALIEKSFQLLAGTGDRFVYIPLLAETNLGNAESMVRWIRKPDGTYDWDFSVLDRYLDIAQKHGKPEVVCLAFWDVYLERVGYLDVEPYVAEEVKKDRTAHKGQGPIVTLLDPATGKTEPLVLPELSEAKSKELWKPLCDRLRARLAARGLDKAAALGFCTDAYPTQAVVDLFRELMPGLAWHRASHGGGDKLYGQPMAYVAHVWGPRFAKQFEEPRMHGWQGKDLRLFFLRAGFDPQPMGAHRAMAELAITGSERGVGRLGADMWPVMKDKRGRRVGSVSQGRYPKSSWRALNIVTSYLAPAPDGPVATARFEMVREGLEECEARIAIENALTDKTLRAKLDDDLAKRAQALLDERLAAGLRSASSFIFGEHFTINAADNHSWWHITGPLGAQWFVSSGWQDRTRRLYDMADEVERAAGRF